MHKFYIYLTANFVAATQSYAKQKLELNLAKSALLINVFAGLFSFFLITSSLAE